LGHPEATSLGIGIAVASSILMPFLATTKKRAGRRIGSKALVADGACSMVCAKLIRYPTAASDFSAHFFGKHRGQYVSAIFPKIWRSTARLLGGG
jgi:hypothetical protein